MENWISSRWSQWFAHAHCKLGAWIWLKMCRLLSMHPSHFEKHRCEQTQPFLTGEHSDSMMPQDAPKISHCLCQPSDSPIENIETAATHPGKYLMLFQMFLKPSNGLIETSGCVSDFSSEDKPHCTWSHSSLTRERITLYSSVIVLPESILSRRERMETAMHCRPQVGPDASPSLTAMQGNKHGTLLTVNTTG